MCAAYLQACNGFPSNTNDNDSDTWALGCGATAIWNSNSVGAVISTSSSAPTSRFIVLMMRLSIWIGEPSDGAGSDVGLGTYPDLSPADPTLQPRRRSHRSSPTAGATTADSPYADRHGSCATRTQSRRPRWRLLGHHRGVHLRAARADAAVGALRGDRQRHQRQAPQHRSTSATRSQLSPTLQATTDFSEAADCADVIVMGVPSHGFRGVLEQLAKELRPWVPVVSLVKGLEQGTNMRMSQIVDEVLPGHPAGILAGPNIAREVADGLRRRRRAGDARPTPGRQPRKPVPHQAFSHVHHRRRRSASRWRAR